MQKLVEAAGIEPASEDLSPQVSTRVVPILVLAVWAPRDRIPCRELFLFSHPRPGKAKDREPARLLTAPIQPGGRDRSRRGRQLSGQSVFKIVGV